MNEYFSKFLDRIQLTNNQLNDAKRKYNWVCKVLHDYFYGTNYDWSTKLLFWSYKKKTNIRPITTDQDVDVLFKLPEDIYNQYSNHNWNGQSKLLQKIKDVLSKKYSTTENIKWWGKVILVEFADNTHNVELLPAFENNDKTFFIPNSSDWWSWEQFNPRKGINNFFESNNNTKGLTRKLSRIIKNWSRNIATSSLKSYIIEEYVIEFLKDYNLSDWIDYSILLKDYFEYLLKKVDKGNYSHVDTALKRCNNALKYINESKIESAVDEYTKIFWWNFPRSVELKELDIIHYKAPDEEFIENLYNISINNNYNLLLSCDIDVDWFRKYSLIDFVAKFTKLPKKKKLTFKITNINIPEPFDVKWKIRNFWRQAEIEWDLRWKIHNDWWSMTRVENTKYQWDHLVECYIIKDNICVYRKKIEVPIE